MKHLLASLLLAFVLIVSGKSDAAEPGEPVAVMVGAAKIDITPELPIRLTGFESRKTEANRAETRLFARALAIGSDEQKPAVLITLELIGVGAETSEVVAEALRQQHGIPRERLAISVIHTHTGPALSDVLPYMFAVDLTADETARIHRYTTELRTKLIQLAGEALARRQPSHLAWAQGSVDFAAQRRVVVDGVWKSFGVTPEGPFDHALPVLRVTSDDGTVRAVLLSYACHCTTLSGSDNYVHHDWAGNAAERLESRYPGAVALVALGCGADANPNPRGAVAVTEHGASIAREVERVLGGAMHPLGPLTIANYREVPLEFDRVVPRAELQQRVASKDVRAAYAASKFLERLDAGQPLPKGLTLPVQAWSFGKDLKCVFLGGEVVSEYSLRLRRELDGARLWINAYSNGVPCYIPSQRMYAERGYEVDGSMDYYGWPTRLAVGTEDRVIAAVHDLVPASLRRSKLP
ncbi:MAG: neutral/alkaline non-lysosomal ceramidase N-terminal domain-containing protein [Opitutus sp.]